ncbi:MAG: DMT family transporter, partial [Firmicutes bacterium]|nr:DMT family transporter [Bacillota bacterium]
IPFFKTIPSLKQLAAVLLSVAGVFFIVLMKGNVELGYNVWGTLALLGAVISGALYNVLSKKSTLSFSAVEITYIMMWTGAIVFNGFELMRRVVNGSVGQMLVPLADGHVLLAMLYLGVLSSVLAFFLMNYMLSKMGASQTATYINLTTVVSIVAGVLLRGESFAWYQGVGAVMIVLGVWGSSYYGRAVATATLTQQSNVIAVETK